MEPSRATILRIFSSGSISIALILICSMRKDALERVVIAARAQTKQRAFDVVGEKKVVLAGTKV